MPKTDTQNTQPPIPPARRSDVTTEGDEQPQGLMISDQVVDAFARLKVVFDKTHHFTEAEGQQRINEHETRPTYTVLDHTTQKEYHVCGRGRLTVTQHAVCKYFWGRFNPVGSPADMEIPKGWVQGVGRQWKRGELVIVPSTYLAVFRNANIDRFKMVPGKPEKKLAPYNGYGFSVDMTMGKNGEATEEEYREQLDKGTAHNQSVLKQQQAAAQADSAAG